MQFEKQTCSVLVCSNIRFLSSDLLYVSEVVFICIFYNKYIVSRLFSSLLCVKQSCERFIIFLSLTEHRATINVKNKVILSIPLPDSQPK